MNFGRLLSLSIAFTYAIVAVHWAGLAAWKWCLGLLLPLALIWFPEEIGSVTGYYKTGYVNVQTPGPIVAFFGWAILVGLPVLAFLLRK